MASASSAHADVNPTNRKLKNDVHDIKPNNAIKIIENNESSCNGDSDPVKYQVVKRKDNKNKNKWYITGSVKDELVKASIPKKKGYVVCTRVSPETTMDDFSTMIKKNIGENTNCEKLASKHPESYSSFRVTIDKDVNSWPEGALIYQIQWGVEADAFPSFTFQ
ncbi:hypothetical protein HHI36_003172 [Cryptolaemus montrouzieri]|uniref:Uncharacterized protein n=1 Tax=Cryptolaemus montrouzieri TaxID=559131 RepID=A0ABD2PD56_9CUCU